MAGAQRVKALAWASPAGHGFGPARQKLSLATDQRRSSSTRLSRHLGRSAPSYKTILVLIGRPAATNLAKYAYQPDKIVPSIADLDPSAHASFGPEFELDSSITASHPSHRSA